MLTLVDSTLPENPYDDFSYLPPPYCPSASKVAGVSVDRKLFVYEKVERLFHNVKNYIYSTLLTSQFTNTTAATTTKVKLFVCLNNQLILLTR